MRKFVCLALLPMLVLNTPIATTENQNSGEKIVVSVESTETDDVVEDEVHNESPETADVAEDEVHNGSPETADMTEDEVHNESPETADVMEDDMSEVVECDGTFIRLYGNDEARICTTVKGENCVVSTIYESSPSVAYEVQFSVNDIPEVNVDYNSDVFWKNVQSYGANNLDKANVVEVYQDTQFNEKDNIVMQNSIIAKYSAHTTSDSDVVLDKLKSIYGNEYTNRGVRAKVYKNKSVFITDSMHFETQVLGNITWQKGASLASIIGVICTPKSVKLAKAIKLILGGLGLLTSADTLISNVGTTHYRAMSVIDRDAKIDGKLCNSTPKYIEHRCVLIGKDFAWEDDPDIYYGCSQYYFEDCDKFVSDAYDMWTAMR